MNDPTHIAAVAEHATAGRIEHRAHHEPGAHIAVDPDRFVVIRRDVYDELAAAVRDGRGFVDVCNAAEALVTSVTP